MPLKLSGSKLFLLLSSMSREELEDFRVFIGMPLMNNSESLDALLEYCISIYPEFPEAMTEKKRVHNKLFPGKDFAEKRIRDLFSDLSLLATRYLGWRFFVRDEGLNKWCFIRELKLRGLEDNAVKEGTRRLARLEEGSGRGADRHFQQFRLRELLFGENENFDKYLWDAHEDLDHFFMLSKLRLSAVSFSRRGYLSGVQEIRFLEEIRHLAATKELPELERLYLRIIELISGEIDKDSYRVAKTEFFRLAPSLEFDDRRVLFQSLINFTLRVINESEPGFVEESWDLYMRGLESQAVFTEKGELSDITFTNIVINGANIEKFEETSLFILDYEGKLPPEVRDNAVALGKASLNYHQKKYDLVIGLLRDVRYSSVSYALRGRSLLLRTYFDQAMGNGLVFSQEFFSLQEAFYKYVKRNEEISEGRKQGYLHFLTFIRTLAQIAGSRGKRDKRLEKLMLELEPAQQVIAKDWLLKRAGAIGRLK